MSQNEPIDSRAFEILVREHHRMLLAYAMALTSNAAVAEDLAQDAFLAAYQHLDRFDPARDFAAWVRGIVRNKYREWARKRREIPVTESVLEGLEQQHGSWHGAADKAEDVLHALQTCLGKLPEHFARVVDMFYMKDLPGAEIATRMSQTETAVRKRLQRARERLATCIEQALAAPPTPTESGE